MIAVKFFITCVLGLVLSVSAFAQGQHPAPPGRLIDVNGRNLHLRCQGEGSPTVVLESAIGGWSVDWERVQPLVAEKTRVCSYDRAGYGWSEPRNEESIDSLMIARELHQLLVNAGESGPYLLAAHSLGGFHLRVFVHSFPDEVVGAVLVDSSHEDQFSWEAPPVYWKPPVPEEVPSEPEFNLDLIEWTSETRRLIDISRQDPVWQATTNKESEGIAESVRQLRESDSLPDIPLIVLTAGEEKSIEDYWSPRDLSRSQLQRDLASLVPRSEHIHVPGSLHYIHLDDPEIVAESINRVVEVARRAEK